MRGASILLFTLAAITLPSGAQAQDQLNRIDPARVERELPLPKALETGDFAEPIVSGEDEPLPRSSATVLVGAIRVEGATVIAPSEFAGVIDQYLGKELDSSGLKALSGAIADVARAKGYVFATAWIEPQFIGQGLLRVYLDEGRVHSVRIEGPPNAAVRRALEALVSGSPVTTAALERQILLAGDVPGIIILSKRYARIDGKGVLIVKLGQDKFVGRAGIDNRGNSAIGPVRIRLGYDMRSLLRDGDELSVQAIAAPLGRELGLVAASYTSRVGNGGTALSLSSSYGRSKPGGLLKGLGVTGKSVDVSLGVSHPIFRSRSASLWAYGDATFRHTMQYQDVTTLRADTTTTLTVGFRGNAKLLGGRLYGGVSATQGLNIFGATRAGDPLASRVGVDAGFTKANAWADWNRSLIGPFSIRLGAVGQIASQPLLAGEEFGLGGANIGRGYDYFERSGDRGIAGIAELRASLPTRLPIWVRSVQLYGFVDGGIVDDVDVARGSSTLFSAGGGIRAGLLRSLDVAVEAAAPLTGDRFDSGNRSPRISASLSTSF
jgi:hemolysin activation/secretion protein